MAKRNPSRRALPLYGSAALLMASLLSGCITPPPPLAPAIPADPEAALPMPGAMNQFELAPDDKEVIGELQRVRAHREDTLSDIARRFNVGYEEIVAANPKVDPWLPGTGTEVIIPSQWVLPKAPHKGIVINLAAMRLFYFPPAKKGEPQRVITHPVGIGRIEWKTPQGKTRVASKAEAPAWIPTAAIRREHEKDGDPLPAVIPPGPDNPMGAYVMRLGWPEYAIHGTNKPASIGMRGTHGCLRMYPEDIAALYEKVPVDTQVAVVNEPYLTGFRDETLYLQAYPVLEDDKRDHMPRLRALIKQARAEHRKRTGKADHLAINDGLLKELSGQPRALTLPVSIPATTVEQLLAESAEPVKNRLPLAANWDGEGDVAPTALSAAPTPTQADEQNSPRLAANSLMTDSPAAAGIDNGSIGNSSIDSNSIDNAATQPAADLATSIPGGPVAPEPDFKSGVASDL